MLKDPAVTAVSTMSFEPVQAAAVQGALGIALIVGRAFAGFLMDRFFAPFVAVVILAFPMLGISLLALHSILDMILIILALPISNQIFIKAQNQLVQILNSRTLWLAVAMLFLIYTVPGFNTALIFQQTDVFKMDPQTIGNLSALEGVFGLVGAALYALYCKKLNLKSLIIIGVGLNAAFTLLYLKYSPGTAMYIHSVAGFVVVLSELSLMDLAVRSTPRGCEALGFALMMSIRNFGIALSDILGSNLMDVRHLSFNSLIWVNAITTAVVLLFIPILPRAVLSRKEGE